MKTKLLIAEDDPALIKVYRMALQDIFEVEIACNGQEALDAANVHRPDIIVMDVMMPVMDGLEALARLKDNPATATIPVILLTAKVQHNDVLDGYKTGADYYITKPFTTTELLNGINLCLGTNRD